MLRNTGVAHRDAQERAQYGFRFSHLARPVDRMPSVVEEAEGFGISSQFVEGLAASLEVGA
jgi:hypothetical protein